MIRSLMGELISYLGVAQGQAKLSDASSVISRPHFSTTWRFCTFQLSIAQFYKFVSLGLKSDCLFLKSGF